MSKVIDIEERIPSMREKRRRKTNKKFILTLTVFVLALLVVLYLQSPLSKVEKIQVNGGMLHDADFYVKESEILIGKSLWSVRTGDVEKKLEKLKGVQHAEVSRKWYRDIEITITEWPTIAYVEEEGQYRLVVENGELFPHAETFPGVEAPILNNFLQKDEMMGMIKQLVQLDKSIYHLLSEIVYVDREGGADRVIAYMDDGYEVHAIISTFAEKMAYYPEMIAQLDDLEKGVIDIEVGTYFIPYRNYYGGENETEVEAEEGEMVDDGEAE
ncbi:cell division protein FtsQ/DivIB [Sporosarcina sp. HYO08]|uniref:cell division protein FtsQ/DivIB n=1 Tax=Sporosarcina sp. HYO08 TaxID=1759557 RepID=UPI0007929707|nr:FtsQ-type POTRA domain-containing protein [Sporosarcina sp. HYO08]KXH79900.1 hypothetical protein AU377_10505 [Sporosarcina sp. HYO08]